MLIISLFVKVNKIQVAIDIYVSYSSVLKNKYRALPIILYTGTQMLNIIYVLVL